MTTALLWIASGLMAALVSARAGRHLARIGPLRGRNYRGLEVSAAAGIAVLLGFLAALALLAGLRAVVPSSRMLADAAGAAVPVVGLVLGFGLLGLWDDLAGDADRGWKAHVRALRAGRATSGAIKMAGGAALALVVVAPRGDALAWTLVDAAIVALTANLYNLFDIRPGRTGKLFIVAALAMLVVGGPTGAILAAGIGAVTGFLPLDLRERVMLGDTGANALGAVIGYAIVATGAAPVRAATLVVLVGLHLVADEPGLSRIIRSIPPLRRFDDAGRVAEPHVDPGS